MVEGKVQIEGEVIHVIAEHCYNSFSLLRTLTLAHNDNLPLLTLAYADEKSIPSKPDKRSIRKENDAEKAMPGARNFK